MLRLEGGCGAEQVQKEDTKRALRSWILSSAACFPIPFFRSSSNSRRMAGLERTSAAVQSEMQSHPVLHTAQPTAPQSSPHPGALPRTNSQIGQSQTSLMRSTGGRGTPVGAGGTTQARTTVADRNRTYQTQEVIPRDNQQGEIDSQNNRSGS